MTKVSNHRPRLSDETLGLVPSHVVTPGYDRGQAGIGVVHIGPGAFFRGHQAWYTEQALANGGDWAISVVSLQSGTLQKALAEQGGLYTIAVIDAESHYEVIGAVKELLVAESQFAEVMTRLAAPTTHFVTLTITEKGYCLNADGKLNLEHPSIVKDLADSERACSAIGVLVLALARRFAAGLRPFCVLSCDNLTQNGVKLKQALLDFTRLKHPALGSWLETELLCPSTMVDSITPATDDALIAQVESVLGAHDAWPIKREAFCQWVIEDTLPALRPDWAAAGAILTKDVQGFEKAKLRLLNAPHSALAYLGSLLGYTSVFDAMQDPALQKFVRRMVTDEIAESFAAPPELEVANYSDSIFNRFNNPGIRHLLAQIAWDGSQKMSMRILPIIADNLATGRPIQALCTVLAAWFGFIRLRYQEAQLASAPQPPLVDPLASKLFAIAERCTGEGEHDVAQWLGLSEVFPQALRQDPAFIAALSSAVRALAEPTPTAVHAAMNRLP